MPNGANRHPNAIFPLAARGSARLARPKAGRTTTYVRLLLAVDRLSTQNARPFHRMPLDSELSNLVPQKNRKLTQSGPAGAVWARLCDSQSDRFGPFRRDARTALAQCGGEFVDAVHERIHDPRIELGSAACDDDLH